MAKQFFKKKSKRITTRKRAKIEKKVKEHNRKLRQESKKGTKFHKTKKDPGVPNSYPFKEQVLKEAEEKKIKAEEERQLQKDRRKKSRQNLLAKKRNLGNLVSDAEQRSAQFNKKQDAKTVDKNEKTNLGTSENSLKAYYKEFRKVVEAADVVIQVLDARDPLGSRCAQVEETVLAAGSEKRLLLLLNKIDLVPKENVESWLKYLRNEFPTLAFKASTQEQTGNLSQSRVPLEKASADLRQSSRCLGADMLMKLLANYCRNKDIKTSITVGVVGFPNTGKSSVINSLKRSKACNVGATPGVTKAMQTVQLDKNIKLLDSPGIVMATGGTDSQVILRNCVKIEAVEDPLPPVEAILRRCSKQKMMLQYNVPEFGDVNEFLAHLAKRMGKLKKGGIPDTLKASRAVLHDWNNGKIRYYTEPPEANSAPSQIKSEIVVKMSAEFDIGALLGEEGQTLKDLKQREVTDMVVESLGPVAGVVTEADVQSESGDEEMEDDTKLEELKNVVVAARKAQTTAVDKKVLKEKVKVSSEMMLEGNRQLHKNKKIELKRLKKKRKKADKLGSNLSDALEGAFAGLGSEKISGGDYEFGVDFK